MSPDLLLAELTKLNAAGTVMMTLCVALVLSLCTLCFRRILRKPKPLEIDTHDRDG